MKKDLSFLKDNAKEIFLSVVLILSQFLLLGNLYTRIISSLLSFSLSLFLLKKKNQEEKELSSRLSSYSFFFSFIKGIEDNIGIKAAYEGATRYLIGYQEVIVYEELDEHSLLLYDYQGYFDFIIEKDKINQANMMLYRPLIESVKTRLNQLEMDLTKRKKEFLFLYLALVGILFALSIATSFEFMKNVFENNIYIILSTILFSLLIPSYHYAYCLILRGLKDEKA